MGEIDFLLDKVQRTLDELRMQYKTHGAANCASKLEFFQDSCHHLNKVMDKCF